MKRRRFRLAFLAFAAILAGGPTAGGKEPTVAAVGRIVSRAIARCFVPPPGVQQPYAAVPLLLNFRPDGNLDGPPQFFGAPDVNAGSEAVRRSVLSAAIRCGKIENADRFRQSYLEWRTLRLIFRPGAPEAQ